MSLENNLNNTMNNEAPHPNHKRIIIMVAISFVVIIALFFLYQYFANKKAEKARDLVLREQYRTEQVDELKSLFETLEKDKKPMVDADKKRLEVFFKNNETSKALADDAELKTFFESSTSQKEQSYQDWKSQHSK